MTECLLSASDMEKQYGNGKKQTCILNKININIYKNDFTIIMGPSGAGKSTLLYLLGGLDEPTKGTVLYRNKDMADRTETEKAKMRAREFGFVFQQSQLISDMTLYENVLLAGFAAGKREEDAVRRRADRLFSDMKLEKVKHQYVTEVSGGEAQRTQLVRAVITEPDILFADEPTGALNRENTEGILDQMLKMNQSGQTILMVTHDIRCALRGNRIIYLEDGKVKDELSLPVYEIEGIRNRERKVTEWLEKLRW